VIAPLWNETLCIGSLWNYYNKLRGLAKSLITEAFVIGKVKERKEELSKNMKLSCAD